MQEQEIYKNVLSKVIHQTEKSQIHSTAELVQQILHELDHYQLPRIKYDNNLG